MANKVMIIGTGNVGASIAYCLANQRTSVDELLLTDINEADAEGEAMDLKDALTVSPASMKVRTTDQSYSEAGDCDIVVITAGIPQKPGESRLELLSKNAKILKDMVDKIMESGFDGIFLVVTNPMDVMTYLTWTYSGLPSDQVIGSGTVLDSARLCHRIGERLGVNPKSVHALQVGEHGDSEFALWSSANLGGQPLAELLDKSARAEIEDYARKEAYEIIDKKGATYYGIGACVARIINSILYDERRVLPVSSYDDFADVYNGFPAIVGRHGIVRRLGIKLSEEEGMKLQKSTNILRQNIDSVLK